MKIIREYVDQMKEELEGAKCYAEKYLYYKAQGNQKFHKYYFEMAQDELKHAMYVHEIASDEIARLKAIYKPTEEMEEVWRKEHAKYVEMTAWIRQMLQM